MYSGYGEMEIENETRNQTISDTIRILNLIPEDSVIFQRLRDINDDLKEGSIFENIPANIRSEKCLGKRIRKYFKGFGKEIIDLKRNYTNKDGELFKFSTFRRELCREQVNEIEDLKEEGEFEVRELMKIEGIGRNRAEKLKEELKEMEVIKKLRKKIKKIKGRKIKEWREELKLDKIKRKIEKEMEEKVSIELYGFSDGSGDWNNKKAGYGLVILDNNFFIIFKFFTCILKRIPFLLTASITISISFLSFSLAKQIEGAFVNSFHKTSLSFLSSSQ